MSGKIFTQFFVGWGLIGIVGFTLMVVFYWKIGAFTSARDENGKLRKPIPIKGIISMLSVLVAGIGFMVLADYFVLYGNGVSLGYGKLYLMNFGLFAILLLFDTFVIDILVLVVWHPAFLKLPDGEVFTSVKHHLKTLIPGTLWGGVLSLIGTTIAYLLFKNFIVV